MPPIAPQQPSTTAGKFAEFPALATLNLTDLDLVALGRQGFVGQERRQDRIYYKLRFRSGSRQVVRYIGGAGAAAAIAEELERLQAGRRRQRELAKLGQLARKILRQSKVELNPLLASRGFRFHGMAIRRRRQTC